MNLSTKAIKATRKEHQCCGCYGIIPKGSAAFYYFGISDGDATFGYQCVPCYGVWDRHYHKIDPDGEGYGFGDILECARESGFNTVAEWLESLDKSKEVQP